MTNRIVLIGAGSANFGLGTIGDILKSKPLAGSTIVLHDINPAALARVTKIAQRYIDEKRLPFTLMATTKRQEALPGATFCINAIEVGNRFALWEQDWKIPLQYGIRQVFGENGGPGGLFHALRIIPPILAICEDIATLCPDATVFNFSNPMSRICLAVKRKYPALELIGLCHEVASLPMHLPLLLGTPLANLSFRAGGLNHFSVLLEVAYKDSGQDAYPDVRAKAPAYFANMPDLPTLATAVLDPASGPPQLKGPRWAERTLFKVILERFGYLPITTDSHFGEYIQWAYAVADHRRIIDFYNFYHQWCLEQVPESRIAGTYAEEYWRAVPIMEGILSDSGQEELAVNILNEGLIDNLPHDLVVETPAVVDRQGVHGIKLGALPKGIAGLLNNQVAVQDLTVEAALAGSRELALQALLVDPVVDQVAAAEQLLATMLDLQQEYLGYLQ
ncbi:MAG: alpha-glucosidase [Caldilineaceae bacterium]